MLTLLPLLFTTTAAAASASAAAASLTIPLPTPLLPWLIPRLSTHSPSGYPANHPYSRLSFAISDPNTITLGATRFGDAAFPPSAANCTVWWLGYTDTPRDSNPRDGGWVNTCEPPAGDGGPLQGKWTFRVVNGTAGGGVTTDFGLVVALEEAVVLGNGGIVAVRFEGEAQFRVGRAGSSGGGEDGTNMGGSCGGSGVCNWGLRGEMAPVEVRQRLVEVRCVAGTCDLDEGVTE